MNGRIWRYGACHLACILIISLVNVDPAFYLNTLTNYLINKTSFSYKVLISAVLMNVCRNEWNISLNISETKEIMNILKRQHKSFHFILHRNCVIIRKKLRICNRVTPSIFRCHQKCHVVNDQNNGKHNMVVSY